MNRSLPTRFVHWGSPVAGGMICGFAVILLLTSVLSPERSIGRIRVFCWPMLAVGLVSLTARRVTVVDHEGCVVRRSWGALFIPLFRRTYSLSRFSQVTARPKEASSEHGSTTYVVALEGNGLRVMLRELLDREDAYRMARDMAREHGIGLWDATPGMTVERSSSALRQPLKSRLQPSTHAPGSPSAPKAGRLKLQREGESFVIQLPSPSRNPRLKFAAVVGLAAAAVGTAPFVLDAVRDGKAMGELALFFIVPMVALGVGLVLFQNRGILGALRTQEVIIVSPKELVVLQGGAAQAGPVRIPMEDLEDVIPGKSPLPPELPGLLLRGRKVSCCLGAGLDDQELKELREMILHAVASVRPPTTRSPT